MDILKPFGKRDILLYYSIIAKKLQKFLKNKEIATKIWLPTGFFLRRGSQMEPLYIEEFKNVTKDFIKLRAEMPLQKAKVKAKIKITKQQEKLWLYFPQDKLIDFFYATNKEGRGKILERIYFDIDRGKQTNAGQAQEVALKLLEIIKKDKELKKIIQIKSKVILWTGKSFHIYLLLKKSVSSKIYEKYFSYSKHKPLESLTGKWADQINKQTKFKVAGGHEKKLKIITIDPSQTPSGKLARCPFALHIKNPKEIDGISVPLSEKMLRDKNLIKKLKTLTPDKVIKELNTWAKNLR